MQNYKFSNQDKIILLTIILISLGYYIKYNFQGYVWREKIDFNAFYYATKAYFAGLNPYDHKNVLKMKLQDNILDYAEDFPLPPFTLFFFRLFNFLYIRYAQLIWLIFCNTLFFCAIYFIYKYIYDKFKDEQKKKVFALIFLFFSFHYYGATVWENALGNLNNILFFLLVATFFLYKKQKNLLAGICFGLACAIKIIPIVLIPFFLFKKKIKVIIYSLSIFLLLLTAPFIITGDKQVYNDWINHGLTNVYASHARPFNQSIKGFFMRIFSPKSFYTLPTKTIELITLITAAIIGIAFLIIAFKYRTYSELDDELYSIFVLYIIFASSRSWETWYMFLILPFNLQFIFLLKFSDKNFNIYTLLFFIAGFILVAVDFPYQDHRLL